MVQTGRESVYLGRMALEPIRLGSITLDPFIVLLALAGLAVLALIVLAVALIMHMKGRRREVEVQAARSPSTSLGTSK